MVGIVTRPVDVIDFLSSAGIDTLMTVVEVAREAYREALPALSASVSSN